MAYWQDRIVNAQDAISKRTIIEIQKQLRKYYSSAMKQVIDDFIATYTKVLMATEEDREITPADLYKLDKYWQMQAQLKEELQKLGDKEHKLLSENFEKERINVYESIAIKGDQRFNTISTQNAKKAINTTWVADGKTWSQRVWSNTEQLAQKLNDSLVACVITGKKPAKLKQELMAAFGVSYRQADMLVHTEIAHIQTQAAADRYKDAGLTKYKFLGREEHDIGCDCKKLNGKIFTFAEAVVGVNMPPLHPNCRCAIAPVVEDKEKIEIKK